MNFNKLVNNILNETTNQLPILRHDDDRVVYLLGISLDTLRVDPEAARLEEDALLMWDDDYADASNGELIGTFNDFTTALKALNDAYKVLCYEFDLAFHDETRSCNLPDYTKQIITDKIGHLIGKWKVIKTEIPDSTNWTDVELVIGVDIDLSHYNTGGLRDAVKTAIDDTDDIIDW